MNKLIEKRIELQKLLADVCRNTRLLSGEYLPDVENLQEGENYGNGDDADAWALNAMNGKSYADLLIMQTGLLHRLRPGFPSLTSLNNYVKVK